MIVQCEQCMAKYKLDGSRIPGETAKVKCSRCQHIFHVTKESPSLLESFVPPSIEEAPKESTLDSLQCPNCGFHQPHSEECIKCGIIFSKYKPRAEIPPPPYAHRAGGYGLEENLMGEQAEVRSMTYAGFWPRFGAYFIDGIVAAIIVKISMYVTMLPMTYYFSQAYMSGNPQLGAIPPSLPMALFLGISLSLGLQALYYILMWGYRGATLGKMAMKIKIVSTDGADISYGTAFLRYIGTIISGIPFSLGYLWMLWDDSKQTWHDKIASTYVVRTQ
ncbi:MAG: hypothetical protein GTO13_17045 [Proteobacteria bacterium]|nr:hypothetical protein [Pseudomonadota bacterium]